MNKKGSFFIIWAIFWTLVLISFLSFVIIKTIQVKNSDCLISIAKEQCSERGMVYEDVYYDLSEKFACKRDLRGISKESFKFLEEEIEGCKK